jgi:hypothetical protein
MSLAMMPNEAIQPFSPHAVHFSPGQRQHPPRRLHEWIQYFVHWFIIRGTHSPMQWMLDLRTYEMKAHFNTTTLGSVGWMDHDQVLYKQF